MDNILKVATVFSGIGAFEQALEKLHINHDIIFACDNDKYVKSSYCANYKPKKWFNDIKEINKTNISESIDIFVGGSPCQSFSTAGKRLGFKDTRGTLFFEYARLVKELQPRFFIYENVKGLLSHNNGNTFKTILNTFEDLGYFFTHKVLNAKNFGIPQSRNRIFIVGFKYQEDYNNFYFPKEFELKLKVKDLLELNVNEKYFLSEKMINYILNDNCNGFNNNPSLDTDIAKTLTATMVKMHRASTDNYITNNGRIRRLTPRECFRLMGFPDSFKFVVSDSQLYKQAGNSIVVNVLEKIIKNII